MKYAYVGETPGNLASGRPLVFGDRVDASELTPEDERLSLAPLDSSPQEATGPEPSTNEAE